MNQWIYYKFDISMIHIIIKNTEEEKLQASALHVNNNYRGIQTGTSTVSHSKSSEHTILIAWNRKKAVLPWFVPGYLVLG